MTYFAAPTKGIRRIMPLRTFPTVPFGDGGCEKEAIESMKLHTGDIRRKPKARRRRENPTIHLCTNHGKAYQEWPAVVRCQVIGFHGKGLVRNSAGNSRRLFPERLGELRDTTERPKLAGAMGRAHRMRGVRKITVRMHRVDDAWKCSSDIFAMG